MGFWITCGVKMSLNRHGWGWQPPQNASCIHIRHVHSVWAHWYKVHRHIATALHSYTHTTWLRCWGSGSHLQSKWCHYTMVEADSHLKLLHVSILDMYKELEHINKVFIGIWSQSYTDIPILPRGCTQEFSATKSKKTCTSSTYATIKKAESTNEPLSRPPPQIADFPSQRIERKLMGRSIFRDIVVAHSQL